MLCAFRISCFFIRKIFQRNNVDCAWNYDNLVVSQLPIYNSDRKGEGLVVRISKLDNDTYKLELDSNITIAPYGRFGLCKLLRRVERTRGVQLPLKETEAILDRDGTYEVVVAPTETPS